MINRAETLLEEYPNLDFNENELNVYFIKFNRLIKRIETYLNTAPKRQNTYIWGNSELTALTYLLLKNLEGIQLKGIISSKEPCFGNEKLSFAQEEKFNGSIAIDILIVVDEKDINKNQLIWFEKYACISKLFFLDRKTFPQRILINSYLEKLPLDVIAFLEDFFSNFGLQPQYIQSKPPIQNFLRELRPQHYAIVSLPYDPVVNDLLSADNVHILYICQDLQTYLVKKLIEIREVMLNQTDSPFRSLSDYDLMTLLIVGFNQMWEVNDIAAPDIKNISLDIIKWLAIPDIMRARLEKLGEDLYSEVNRLFEISEISGLDDYMNSNKMIAFTFDEEILSWDRYFSATQKAILARYSKQASVIMQYE